MSEDKRVTIPFLERVLSPITSLIYNKVDKVAGKNLSTNDYTNAEKEKLASTAPIIITTNDPGDGGEVSYADGTVIYVYE